MNNMKKAFKANELAVEAERHTDNIKDLQVRLGLFSETECRNQKNRFEIVLRGFNGDIAIEADKDLINYMILSEHFRLEKTEKELDNLLNGDIKKLKECFGGLMDGK